MLGDPAEQLRKPGVGLADRRGVAADAGPGRLLNLALHRVEVARGPSLGLLPLGLQNSALVFPCDVLHVFLADRDVFLAQLVQRGSRNIRKRPEEKIYSSCT